MVLKSLVLDTLFASRFQVGFPASSNRGILWCFSKVVCHIFDADSWVFPTVSCWRVRLPYEKLELFEKEDVSYTC